MWTTIKSWFGYTPTSGEKLVMDIKETVYNLQKLGQEARKRHIVVWLKDGGDIVRPEHLVFHKAFRSNWERLG